MNITFQFFGLQIYYFSITEKINPLFFQQKYYFIFCACLK